MSRQPSPIFGQNIRPKI